MRVIRSEVLGLCFGVRDALAIMKGVDRPEEVTVHGELVHNPIVLHQLERRGFRTSDEAIARGPDGDPGRADHRPRDQRRRNGSGWSGRASG